jgi:hypothetical protein
MSLDRVRRQPLDNIPVDALAEAANSSGVGVRTFWMAGDDSLRSARRDLLARATVTSLGARLMKRSDDMSGILA